ncbi:hypothetical protein HN51_040991 [Arachis hypogaea]
MSFGIFMNQYKANSILKETMISLRSLRIPTCIRYVCSEQHYGNQDRCFEATSNDEAACPDSI